MRWIFGSLAGGDTNQAIREIPQSAANIALSVLVQLRDRTGSFGSNGRTNFADGPLIARILLPETAANRTSGGPKGQTLNLTARKSLYEVETKASNAKRK
jgi:hypothetical protein